MTSMFNIKLFVLRFVLFINIVPTLFGNLVPGNLKTNSSYEMTNFNINFPKILYNNGQYYSNMVNISIDKIQEINDNKDNPDDIILQNKLNRKNSNPDIISSVNRTLNPCNDFYTFVCDGWMAHQPEHDYNIFFNRLIDARKNVLDQLQEILIDSLEPFDVIRKAINTFYHKCIDYYQNNRYSTSFLLNKLKKLQNQTLSSLTELMISIYPKHIFYYFLISDNPINGPINTIDIRISEEDFNYYYDWKQKDQVLLDKYKEYLTNILNVFMNDDPSLFDINKKSEEITQRIEVLFSYKDIIYEISSELTGPKDPPTLYDSYSVNEMNTLTPSVNWTKLFKETLPEEFVVKTDIPTMTVNAFKKELFLKVENFISKLSNTSYKYLLDWIFIFNYFDTLDDRFKKIKGDYLSRDIKNENLSVKNTCYSMTMYAFEDFIDYVYITRYLSKTERDNIENMVKNILDTFAEKINDYDWIKSETKMAISKKLHEMVINVGYSDENHNKNKIYSDFSKLQPYDISDFYNEINEKVFNWRYFLRNEKLLSPTKDLKNDWKFIDTIFYSIGKNSINIPLTFVHNDFYIFNNPIALNYGEIGTLIGYAIISELNEYGSQYLNIDNMNERFENNTTEDYTKRKECFLQTFKDVIVREKNTNFTYNVDIVETITDDGDLRIVFDALKKVLKANNFQDKPKINGLEDFTDDQLFFMGYAFNYCTAKPKGPYSKNPTYDYSFVKKLRVNNSVRNNEDFRKAFNCQPTDPMVDEKICRIF